MQDIKFRAYIRKANGSSWDWYKSVGGVVSTNTSLTPVNALSYMFDGWQNLEVAFERRLPDAGIWRTYSNQFMAINDAAEILRDIYLTYGIESKAQIYIEIYDATIAVDDYVYLVHGDLDFNSYNSDDKGVTISILEGGTVSQIDSRMSTDYKIPVLGSGDKVWVKLHSCLLPFRQIMVTAESEVVANYPTHSGVLSEGTNIYIGITDVAESVAQLDMLHNRSGAAQSIVLDYDYDYTLSIPSGTTTGAPYQLKIWAVEFDAAYVEVARSLFVASSTVAPGASLVVQGNSVVTYSLGADNRLRILLEVTTTTGPAGTVVPASRTITQGLSRLEISFDTTTPETYFSARRIDEVFTELLEGVTENGATITPDYLTALNDFVLFSGDSLRNLVGSEIKTNLNDFEHSVDSIFSTTLFYDKEDDEVSMGQKNDAFQDVEIVDLGEVSNFIHKPLVSENFSNYINGYEEYDLEEVTGKDDPHTLFKWLSPMTSTKREFNQVSRYHASARRILITSLNLNEKKSIDSDNDNEVFIAQISSSPGGVIPDSFPGFGGEDYYDLYIDPSLTITNVYDSENLFNVPLTPKRNLLRNEGYLKSILDKLDSQYLKYQSDAKTNSTGAKMVTDDGVTIIDEGADILISDFATKLFQNVVFEFKVLAPENLYTLLQANPYGYASFTHDGVAYKGFFMKVSQKFAFNEPQQFALLAHPTTDLTNLS
jgi:hypothetical protein